MESTFTVAIVCQDLCLVECLVESQQLRAGHASHYVLGMLFIGFPDFRACYRVPKCQTSDIAGDCLHDSLSPISGMTWNHEEDLRQPLLRLSKALYQRLTFRHTTAPRKVREALDNAPSCVAAVSPCSRHCNSWPAEAPDTAMSRLCESAWLLAISATPIQNLPGSSLCRRSLEQVSDHGIADMRFFSFACASFVDECIKGPDEAGYQLEHRAIAGASRQLLRAS